MRRDKFSLSHYKLSTMEMGVLTPISWWEALPGDTVQQSTSALVRVSPLLSPVMHPVKVRIHHWFVPNRLLWDDWEDFITGGEDGNDSTEYPYISQATITEATLFDHLGIPPGSYAPNLEFSALPFRAYNLIYNEFYRDQDLVTERTVSKGNGADSTTQATLQKVAWEKDYFTTARPWEQKGTQVTVPIGTSAPVSHDNAAGNLSVYDTTRTQYGRLDTGAALLSTSATAGTEESRLYADLSNATGVSINDLRLALAIQRYQEARAQFGSRYVEYLRYLGVRSSDARMQRPEYLGGGRQIIQFSEVLQTAEGASAPVGSMLGHGLAAMRTNRYRRFFEEHGIVMTLMSIVPKTIYTQAINRKWHREVKEDYFQKELQFLGDQPILNKETFADHSTPEGVFGYQSRYDEYRWLPSTIAGEFHSTLDHWHLARIHAGDTALNQSFTDCVPTKRVLASAGTDALYVMSNHSIQARRMLKRNAKPKTF